MNRSLLSTSATRTNDEQRERERLITQNVKQYVKRTREKEYFEQTSIAKQRLIIIYRRRVIPEAQQGKVKKYLSTYFQQKSFRLRSFCSFLIYLMFSNKQFCLMISNKCLTGCYYVLENDEACKYSFFLFFFFLFYLLHIKELCM